MNAHLGFTLLGLAAVAACTALMGKDTAANHGRRFAYNLAAGVSWIWVGAWAMHWLHG